VTDGPASPCVLLVDDDDTFRGVLAAELSRRGLEVAVAATGGEALERAGRLGPDVILLDLHLPDLDGLEVLERIREQQLPCGVVVLTGHGTIDTAIQAIRMGAFDYLEKPCPIQKVELAIQKTREHLRLVERQQVLQDGYSPPDVRTGLVGVSPAFQELRQKVARIARSGSSTLILGETGVGKEMVAKLLHAESPRADAPFVVVDCAALDEDLLRSELFGHERGAFTGAVRQKHGLFEVAHGGTLLLDEVGDTSPEIQSKLLRALETGCFRRLGGNREIHTDVWILSATNRDLDDAVRRGRFREDLYFRLSTLTIEVPPLRDRAEDIPVLVEHFAKSLNRRFSASSRFSQETVEVMGRYPWPGNVRELLHVMEQVMVLATDEIIRPEDLPPAVRRGAHFESSGPERDDVVALRDVQRRHVLAVVERVGGNRGRAAELLGISERNLYRLLKKYGWNPRGSA
jgi:DNA-binding NtrC family response regulator